MKFRILGPLELSDDGRSVALRGTKLRTLLAILLVRANEVVSSDRLAEDLWDSEPPPNAIATLQSYISQLRDALGRSTPELLVTRRPGYMLRVAPEDLDAARFERLAHDGQRAQADDDAEAAVQSLTAALELWRGRALDEFVDHDFARGESTRLNELHELVLEDRVDAQLRLGRAAAIVPELEQLVHEQPLRERRWGQLMLALYRANRQADALRTFQELNGVLADELGITPSPDLVTLEQDILLQRVAPMPEPRSPASATRVVTTEAAGEGARLRSAGWETQPTESPSTLLGRSSDRRRLGDVFARLEHTPRAVALVTGEAGIGKTRLATAFARDAVDAGALVLRGRCEAEQLITYQPIIEALRDQLVHLQPSELASLLGSNAAVVARHIPIAAEALPNLPEAPPAGDDTERYRWFEACSALVSAIAGSRPVLAVIDDLHWADRPTLHLLRHLLWHPQPAQLMLLGSFREEDAAPSGPLATFLAELHRELAVERVELDGLDDDAVTTIIEQEAGRTLGPADGSLVRTVLRRSHGNPFFVNELVRHLSESGVLVPGGPPPDSATGEMPSVPAGVRDVVASRLARLPDRTRDLLLVAAVLGSEFDAVLLGEVCGLGLDELSADLEPAEQRHFLTFAPGFRCQFAHTIVREVLYASISSARRQSLHCRITAGLERTHVERRAEQLSELAYHACMAAPLVDPAVAVDYARRAGDDAVSRVAYGAATEHYRRALEVLERAGIDDEVLRVHLLLSLGEAHNRVGDPELAKTSLLAAAEIARGLGRVDLLGRAALAFGGPVPVTPDIDDPRTIELLEDTLEALGDQPRAMRALVLGRLAQWLHRAGALERRELLCDEAVDTARALDDPAILAAVLHSRYWALYGPDSMEERVALAGEIVAIAHRLHDDELALQGEQCRLHALVELGDMDAAREAADRRTRLARKVRQPLYLWTVAVFDALTAAIDGDLDEAETLAREASNMYRFTDLRNASAVYVAQMQQIRWLQGRMEEMIPIHEQLIARDPRRPTWRSALAWACAEAGIADQAARALDELAQEGFGALPRNFEWLATVAGIAVACCRLGDARRATEAYDLLAPFASRNCAAGQSAFYGAVSHHLGALASTMGQTELARDHLHAALERHESLRSPVFVELTRRELAALA